MTVVAPNVLRDYCARILIGCGANQSQATRVAAALVDANLCGHYSHGVRQLPAHVDQIDRGEICLTGEPTVTYDGESLVVVDGQFGFGQVVTHAAVDLAVERAQRHAVAMVALRNANHIDRLGEYTYSIAERGLTAILLVNNQGGGDQQVAPFGGIDRRLTVNSLSVARPGPSGPITLDISLSVLPRAGSTTLTRRPPRFRRAGFSTRTEGRLLTRRTISRAGHCFPLVASMAATRGMD